MITTHTDMPAIDIEAILARKRAAVMGTLELTGKFLADEIRSNIVADGHVVTGEMLGSVTEPIVYDNGNTVGVEVDVESGHSIFPELGFIHYKSHQEVLGTHFTQRAATAAGENLRQDLPEALR